MSEENEKAAQLNIELTEEVAEGQYSNLVIISHSHAEFVLDFICIVPNVPKAKVKSRIITTPQHAKRLMKALAENIQRYESAYGTIKDQEEAVPYPMSFGGPEAKA
jgi:ribonuclease BN (tRNA processing enzyme)